MKEISVECPNCEVITKYERDNAMFYFRLISLLCIVFVFGYLVRGFV